MLAFQAIMTAAKAWKCETTHACCHKDMVAHWRARRQSAWRASGCRHGRSYIPASGTDFACHLNWLLKILVPSPTLDRFHQNFWGGKTGTSTFKSSLGNASAQPGLTATTGGDDWGALKGLKGAVTITYFPLQTCLSKDYILEYSIFKV